MRHRLALAVALLAVLGCGDDAADTAPAGDTSAAVDAAEPADIPTPPTPDVADASLEDTPEPADLAPKVTEVAEDVQEGPDTASSELLNCTHYCAEVDLVCAQASGHAPWPNVFDCVSACQTSAWEPGTLADEAGNTLGCRIRQATDLEKAELSALPAGCAAAGPTGGGVCGGWCDVFCDLALARCVGANEVYGNEEACMSVCAGFATTGHPTSTSGDTVQCRINWATMAGLDFISPLYHCPKLAADGGGVCVDGPDRPGDTCSDAIEVATLPFSETNDTSFFADDYDTAGACVVDSYKGVALPDVVYRYTATSTGPHKVTLSDNAAGGGAIVYVTTGCDDIAADCIDYSGDLYDSMSYDFALEAGATYHLVVDGLLLGDVGPYSIAITGP